MIIILIKESRKTSPDQTIEAGYRSVEEFRADLKVVMAHGKASWLEEVLEKMEASTRTLPLSYHYAIRTDPEEMWEEGHVLLGFDAEERLVQKLPEIFRNKVTWGSRYPHHDTTSAWDALVQLGKAGLGDEVLAQMLGGNAAAQFGVDLKAVMRRGRAPGQ